MAKLRFHVDHNFKIRLSSLARIYTGFHRFTEIGQIFHAILIKLFQYRVFFRLKIKITQFPDGFRLNLSNKMLLRVDSSICPVDNECPSFRKTHSTRQLIGFRALITYNNQSWPKHLQVFLKCWRLKAEPLTYNKMPENFQVSAALTEISFLSQSPLLATYDNIF